MFQHFQNLDFSKLEFERIIRKTEIAMQKIDIEKLIKKNKRNVKFIINGSMRDRRFISINLKVIFPVIVLVFVVFITYSFSFIKESKT